MQDLPRGERSRQCFPGARKRVAPSSPSVSAVHLFRARAVFLRIAQVLGLGGRDSFSSSGATVHSLGASAPGPGDTSKEAFSSPGGGGRRAVAELYYRPDWGSERGRARVAWG